MRAIWLAPWAVVACGGRAANAPAAPPAPPVVVPADPGDAAALEHDLPRLVDRSLAMYQDITQAFAASGADCAGAVVRLRRLAPGYRAVTLANARVVQSGRAGELRAALAPRGDAFDAAAAAVIQSATMTSCVQDAAFRQAFDDLFDAGPSAAPAPAKSPPARRDAPPGAPPP